MHHTKLSTPALWSATHLALSEGRLVDARPMLETLACRADLRDYIGELDVYRGAPLVGNFLRLIQDRINAVNSRVERNRRNALPLPDDAPSLGPVEDAREHEPCEFCALSRIPEVSPKMTDEDGVPLSEYERDHGSPPWCHEADDS